jgi:outer membrane immunogenic protein
MIRKLTIATATAAALAGMIGVASAADLRPVYKAPPVVVPTYNWTGFYLGGHVGYGWGESTAAPTGIVGLIVDPFRSSNDGFIAGGTVGYNYQSGKLVFGLEGEWTWSNMDGSSSPLFLLGFPLPGTSVTGTYENNWHATAAFRVGAAFDTVLLYAKAGMAFANNDYNVNASVLGFNYNSSISETEIGWMVGVGVEWAIGGNWTAKLEANYMDFGQKNHAFSGIPVFGPVILPINADIESYIATVKLGANYRF